MDKAEKESLLELCREGLAQIEKSEQECPMCLGTGVKDVALVESFNPNGFCRHFGAPPGKYFLLRIMKQIGDKA